MPRYRRMVEGILELPDVELKGWLAVVNDVHTITVKELGQLSQFVPTPLFEVKLVEGDIKFDGRMAAWFFAATRAWEEKWEVTLEELVATMSPGVVSEKAKRVAVWKPIERAFERTVVKVTTTKDALFAAITGGEKDYLTCIDLKNRLFACSCPAFNNGGKRHAICKHLLLSIYHHNDALLEESGEETRSWRESLSRAKNHPEKRIMLVNWLYYFIKNVFVRMGFKTGHYEDPNQVEKALELMEE